MADEAKDDRVERGEAVKDAMTHRGCKILIAEYEGRKDKWFKEFRNEELSPEQVKLAQLLYNEICRWLDIPADIIKTGEDAAAEKDRPEQETPIKRAVPLIGRRR